MNRDKLIKKAMDKLSLKMQTRIPEDRLKDHMSNMARLVGRIKPDDLEGPKTFLKLFGEMVDRENYAKEEVQEILAQAKKMGLIKKSLKTNKYMERAWRSILKIFDLKGFMLEN